MIGSLKSILRNRLNVCESKMYLKWFGQNEVKLGHAHHILESVMGQKLNDLLLTDETAAEHQKIHYAYNGESEDEFVERLIRSLNSLFRYTKFLEQKVREKK